MKNLLYGLLVPLFIAADSSCAATLNVSANPTAAAVGSPITVSLDISNLVAFSAPGLGAYDLNVNFDPGLLDFQAATFGTHLDPFELGDIQSTTAGNGTINLFELSLDSPTDLIAHQPSSFNLATLTFNAMASGTSPINISLNALSDASGNALTANILGTSITVSAVPEPSALALMLCGLGVIGVGATRHRQQARPR